MRILFEGGYYSGADTIISRTWWHRRWRQVMKHKRVWTTRSWLVSLFPTRAGVLPLVYVDQFPPSSRASPLALLSALPTTWPQLFVWAGADTNRGRILFHSAQAIVRILFEGGYYSTCGYYSRKYGNHLFKVYQSLIIRFLIHSCLIVHMSNIWV